MKKKSPGIIVVLLPITLLAVLAAFLYFVSSSDLVKNLTQPDAVKGTTTTLPVTPETADNGAGALGPNEMKLTDGNFDAEVINFQGVSLVEFYLSTCTYCQQTAPNLTEAANELKGKVKVGKIEATENPTLSEKYEIVSVPTFIVFKQGAERERVTGVKTKEELIEFVNRYF